ncbi:hypothetical protein CYMTET_55900, partial [Cymbomonas tetramitiformis]
MAQHPSDGDFASELEPVATLGFADLGDEDWPAFRSTPWIPPTIDSSATRQPAADHARACPLCTSESRHRLLASSRASAGSKPGKRKDPYKLGLLVEGGGMRGVVSAGQLIVLHSLGLRDCFDACYGSSAGAMNLTYFLSGQPEGALAYAEDLANKDFLDLRRLLSSKESVRPSMDLSILLDDVMDVLKPLNWDAILSSPVPLKVVATSLDAIDSVLLENFESVEDLKLCLRGSANVPVVAGPPVEHRGHRLVDAMFFEGTPLKSALQDDCTHMLVLSGRGERDLSDDVG